MKTTLCFAESFSKVFFASVVAYCLCLMFTRSVQCSDRLAVMNVSDATTYGEATAYTSLITAMLEDYLANCTKFELVSRRLVDSAAYLEFGALQSSVRYTKTSATSLGKTLGCDQVLSCSLCGDSKFQLDCILLTVANNKSKRIKSKKHGIGELSLLCSDVIEKICDSQELEEKVLDLREKLTKLDSLLLVESKSYFTLDNIDELIRLIEHIVRLSPHSELFQLFNAGLYVAIEDHNSAIEMLRTLVESNPFYLPAGILLASEFIRAGRLDESYALLDDLMVLFPSDGRLRGLAGTVRFFQGQLDTAYVLLSSGLSLDQSVGEIHYLIGYSYMQSGETRDAAKAFERAVSCDPMCQVAYYMLMLCQYQNGNKIDAIVAGDNCYKLAISRHSTTLAKATARFLADSLGYDVTYNAGAHDNSSGGTDYIVKIVTVESDKYILSKDCQREWIAMLYEEYVLGRGLLFYEE